VLMRADGAMRIAYTENMERGDLDHPDQLFRISRQMYEQMIKAELFHEDDRIQLLEGVLVQMSPQKSPHALTIVRLSKLLMRLLGDRADVAPQLPLRATDFSEPEPDLAVWAADLRTIPQRAHLVVEVADSTLRVDRRIKTRIYGDAGVPEYWIVNINDDRLERHTLPEPGGYRLVESLDRSARFALVEFPDIELGVDEILLPPGYVEDDGD
jgi:Uma2 family endonuclease